MKRIFYKINYIINLLFYKSKLDYLIYKINKTKLNNLTINQLN